jgi:aryl-alcohol dehydrogenase-like predicted oxidoreductase
LGNHGLRLSEIGFGCGPTAGLMIGGAPVERAGAVARALELGINYFDTAAVYGDGLSEAHLGQALREVGARPLLGSKVAIGPEDLSDIYGAVVRSVETSLARLDVDAIDLFHLHNRLAVERAPGDKIAVGPLLTVGERLGARGVAEACEDLQRQGKIRFFGFCAFGGEVPAINEVIRSRRFHSLLCYYNLLNPTAGGPAPAGFKGHDYGGVIDRAHAQGMGVVALRVLDGGVLSGREKPHPLSQGKGWQPGRFPPDALAPILKGGRYTPAQIAIRFALAKAEISTVLVGFSELSHIEEAAGCSDGNRLSPEDLSRLEEFHRAGHALREAMES